MVAIARWTLLGLLRSPALGLLWLALLAVVPLVQGLRPMPSPRGAVEVAQAWAYLAGLAGVASALVRLADGRAFLARLDPRTRWGGELAALLAAALYLQLPILAGALLAGARPSDGGIALPAILSADLRLAGLALLLLVPVLATPHRLGMFLALTWLLPALCPARGDVPFTAAWLDPAAALRNPTLPLVLAALASGAALVLAGFLLRTGAAARP